MEMGSSSRRTAKRIYTYFDKHRKLNLIILFLFVWTVATCIFYHRFPQNYRYPNFFAEDGDHFTANIMGKGFIGALLTPFNGYFIFGIYILTELGFLLNSLLHHGQFADLPASYALVSYAFFGLCAALPVLLLHSYVRLPYLLALALLIALLPMPSFDYGTIGTIGNLKFAFVYISFLLVLYRLRLPKNAKRIFIVDFVLAIGMFTTAGCYIALPFILFSPNMLPNIREWKKKQGWLSLLTRDNYALWSFIALGVIAATQVLYVAIHGTPTLPGYLDQPYQWHKTIEVFIARPYLYPFVAGIYHHLRGVFVLAISAVALFLLLRYGTKGNRFLYIFGITTIFFTTAVFIYNRTGVSFHYDHYQTSGFDNFYYTQNFIALTLGVVLLADLAKKWRTIAYAGVPIIILLVVLNMNYTNHSYAPNDFMQYQISPLKTQLKTLCQKDTPNVMFSIYPFTFLHMTVPHDTACTVTVSTTGPTIVNYGLYTKSDKILALQDSNSQFQQTFTAEAADLHAIALYVSTYYQSRIRGYQLRLMDADCRQVIKSANLPHDARDNAYLTIPLNAHLLAGKQYCFSVYSTTSPAPRLALQFAQPVNDARVRLIVNGQPSVRNITFEAVY